MHIPTFSHSKFFFLFVLKLCFSGIIWAQTSLPADGYRVKEDLNALHNDAIPVEIWPPKVQDSLVVYQMPKVVPGTYKVHNYGLFVRDFKAFNAAGDSLPVLKLGINSWQIARAEELFRIQYWVDDTYGSEKGRHIFAPSGSSNEEALFLLNQFAYIGYLEGYKNRSFDLEVWHPKGFFGSGAWPAERSDSLDHYQFPSYFLLHDNPMMYCQPDTSSVWIGHSKVELSLYSPNKKVNADSSMAQIEAVLQASAQYLGGTLPVDKYSILVYCQSDLKGDFSYGALEHHRSTVLYMPEVDGAIFYEGVRDIVAHEFLHIITPLGIHSEYIQDFDFANPKMSRHLWLYEGVTEYNSHLVQVRDSIYSKEEFLEVMRDKFFAKDQYEGLPLTAVSKHTLDIYHDQYQNFYEGGAIAAMALDLYLIEISGGGMRLMDLLNNLSAVFPADTFFKDEDLFRIMGELSFPQVETFMVRHFEAGEPFPWARLFANVGLEYQEEGKTMGWSIGTDELSYDLEQDRFLVTNEEGIDSFGEALGLKARDQIISINGDTLSLFSFQTVLDDFQGNLEKGDEVVYYVARPRRNDKFRIKRLKTKAFKVEYEESHQLKWQENASARQKAWRKIWLAQ
ncbi:hypothetical protein [Croceimicrobium sp.]|uniref:M61 family metallopeptidase n=1 Tax=Croceimicrobium sp. TaxID=2828340 RepID=UPI003BACED22